MDERLNFKVVYYFIYAYGLLGLNLLFIIIRKLQMVLPRCVRESAPIPTPKTQKRKETLRERNEEEDTPPPPPLCNASVMVHGRRSGGRKGKEEN